MKRKTVPSADPLIYSMVVCAMGMLIISACLMAHATTAQDPNATLPTPKKTEPAKGTTPPGHVQRNLVGTTWKSNKEEDRVYTFRTGGKFVWREYYGTQLLRSGEGTWHQSGEDLTMNISVQYIEDGKQRSYIGRDATFQGTIIGNRIIGVRSEPYSTFAGKFSGGGDAPMEFSRVSKKMK